MTKTGGIRAVLIASWFAAQVFAGQRHEPDVLRQLGEYRGWTKLAAAPAQMDPVVAAQCAAPDPKLRDPHLDHFLLVYVNGKGAATVSKLRAMVLADKSSFQNPDWLKKSDLTAPVGTMIVKEKLATPASDKPELLTIMLKREKGFNPHMGDWEFISASGDGKTIYERGKLESCQSCHQSQAYRDFLYLNYHPKAKQR